MESSILSILLVTYIDFLEENKINPVRTKITTSVFRFRTQYMTSIRAPKDKNSVRSAPGWVESPWDQLFDIWNTN